MTCLLQRPSDVGICVSVFFGGGRVKLMRLRIWKSKNRMRSLLLQGPKRIRSYAHRCLVKHVYVSLCGIMTGIDEIAGGFTSKVDFRSLLKMMFNLSMLQEASKWRSPNLFIYQLKWAETDNVALCLIKCGFRWSSKVTAYSKWLLWKHAVFPECQVYFTFGDLHARGIKIHASHVVMSKFKNCCYLDGVNMCW